MSTELLILVILFIFLLVQSTNIIVIVLLLVTGAAIYMTLKPKDAKELKKNGDTSSQQSKQLNATKNTNDILQKENTVITSQRSTLLKDDDVMTNSERFDIKYQQQRMTEHNMKPDILHADFRALSRYTNLLQLEHESNNAPDKYLE